jgi:hypothetical protein
VLCQAAPSPAPPPKHSPAAPAPGAAHGLKPEDTCRVNSKAIDSGTDGLCQPVLGSQPEDVSKWRGSTVREHGGSGDTGGFVEAECRLSTGSDVPAIIDAIKARERRRQELRELLTREEMPRLDLSHVRSEAQRLLNEWRTLLRKPVEQGQDVPQKLIEGRLTFEPREDATGRYYAFRGAGTFTNYLLDSYHKMWRPRKDWHPFPSTVPLFRQQRRIGVPDR